MNFNVGNAYSAQQQGGVYSTYRPEQNPIANAVLGVIFFAVAIAAYPAKLFFRENLGERAVRIIDPFIYIVAFFELGFWTIIASFLLNILMLGKGFDDLSPFAMILAIPFPSIIFLFWLLRRSYKYFKSINLHQETDYTKRVHSFYRGESKYFKSLIGKPYRNIIIKEFHIQLFLEPMVTLLLGIALIILDMTLGVALIIGGICFFIDEWEVIRKRRDMVLDSLDGEMDAVFIEKARSRFRKLKEEDIDLQRLEVGFEIPQILLNGSNNNNYTSQQIALSPNDKPIDNDIIS